MHAALCELILLPFHLRSRETDCLSGHLLLHRGVVWGPFLPRDLGRGRHLSQTRVVRCGNKMLEELFVLACRPSAQKRIVTCCQLDSISHYYSLMRILKLGNIKIFNDIPLKTSHPSTSDNQMKILQEMCVCNN